MNTPATAVLQVSGDGAILFSREGYIAILPDEDGARVFASPFTRDTLSMHLPVRREELATVADVARRIASWSNQSIRAGPAPAAVGVGDPERGAALEVEFVASLGVAAVTVFAPAQPNRSAEHVSLNLARNDLLRFARAIEM